jgi:hypothetical protein
VDTRELKWGKGGQVRRLFIKFLQGSGGGAGIFCCGE